MEDPKHELRVYLTILTHDLRPRNKWYLYAAHLIICIIVVLLFLQFPCEYTQWHNSQMHLLYIFYVGPTFFKENVILSQTFFLS